MQVCYGLSDRFFRDEAQILSGDIYLSGRFRNTLETSSYLIIKAVDEEYWINLIWRENRNTLMIKYKNLILYYIFLL